jgi:hypothetical protein
MRTEWQTDMTKLLVALRNFANAPKKGAIVRMETVIGTRTEIASSEHAEISVPTSLILTQSALVPRREGLSVNADSY